MSAASFVLTEDQFLCSICLDVFTDPVTLSCGHNFCQSCIGRHWNAKAPYQCPNCKEAFSTRPQLKVNTFIREMAAKFRQSAQQKSGSSETQVSKPGSSELTFKRKKGRVAEIQRMIQKRRLKIQELKRSVELSDENADREIAEGVGVFSALKESVERRQAELINSIKEKQRETEKQAEGFIRELEQEISELEKRSSEVEQLSRSEDHLQLLQNFTSLNAAPPTKDWTGVRVHPPSYEGTVVRAVKQLEETISDQMKKMIEAELKRVQQYEVDVTLDPDTAHPNLILSDDGKQVKHGGVRKKLPDNIKRFDECVNVLSKQSFSSGRFYYEVQVKGKTEWDLGVVRESINRKGEIKASPQKGFWTIGLRKEKKYIAAAGPPVRLSLQSGPDRVGVFVDYEEGLVSFYDVDAAALIYSFTGCSFTEKIYPYFGPGLLNAYKNSVPLIICPVSHTK